MMETDQNAAAAEPEDTAPDPAAQPEELAEELRAAIEPRLLAQLVETSLDSIEQACEQLADDYAETGRGFILARVAGGWRFQSHPDQAAYVERFVLEGQTTRLSAAALETLAIVAYKQPISRAQVASIRGVSVDAVVRTLSQRGYIDEVSRDPGPGQAVLYGTTSLFLEKLGLNSVTDLPELGDFVPSPDIVEALEHGLRFDANEETVVETTETAEGTDTAEAEAVDVEPGDIDVVEAEDTAAGAEEVIDLTDGAPADDVVIDLRDEANEPAATES